MGDRVSISFRNGDCESVTLFSHWDGSGFAYIALEYAKLLKEPEDSMMYPLDRLEPETVMVDFIRYLTKDMESVRSNYYLGATPKDGDNSDNGHFIIDLKEMKLFHSH